MSSCLSNRADWPEGARHGEPSIGAPKSVLLLGVPFRWVSRSTLAARIDAAIVQRSGGYACEVCASGIIESSRDPRFLQALRDVNADLPHGAPVAWAVGRLLGRKQERMPGPQVMLEVLSYASRRGGCTVLLYGSTPSVVRLLEGSLTQVFPKLNLARSMSPPFRPTTAAEDAALRGSASWRRSPTGRHGTHDPSHRFPFLLGPGLILSIISLLLAR